MRITRVYTGSDNRSHFEEIELTTHVVGDAQHTALLDALGVRLTESPPDRDMDFHPVSRRQLVITVEGRMEMEVGDGAKRQFGPGDVFLAEDLTGQGHVTRNLGERRRSVIVHLDPSGDASALRGR